jgi:hypothetical protein
LESIKCFDLRWRLIWDRRQTPAATPVAGGGTDYATRGSVRNARSACQHKTTWAAQIWSALRVGLGLRHQCHMGFGSENWQPERLDSRERTSRCQPAVWWRPLRTGQDCGPYGTMRSPGKRLRDAMGLAQGGRQALPVSLSLYPPSRAAKPATPSRNGTKIEVPFGNLLWLSVMAADSFCETPSGPSPACREGNLRVGGFQLAHASW